MNMMVSLRPGMIKDRDDVIRELIDIQYDRNDLDLEPRLFPRARGCAGDISGAGRRLSVCGLNFSAMRSTVSQK